MNEDQMDCDIAFAGLPTGLDNAGRSEPAVHHAIEEDPSRTERSDRRVIRVPGDMTGCEAIRAFFVRCDRTIRRGTAHLIIDLGRVHHADTKLMACLVAIFQMARAASVRMELWASPSVLDMIEFCKLRWLLEHDRDQGVRG